MCVPLSLFLVLVERTLTHVSLSQALLILFCYSPVSIGGLGASSPCSPLSHSVQV